MNQGLVITIELIPDAKGGKIKTAVNQKGSMSVAHLCRCLGSAAGAISGSLKELAEQHEPYQRREMARLFALSAAEASKEPDLFQLRMGDAPGEDSGS